MNCYLLDVHIDCCFINENGCRELVKVGPHHLFKYTLPTNVMGLALPIKLVGLAGYGLARLWEGLPTFLYTSCNFEVDTQPTQPALIFKMCDKCRRVYVV